MNAKCRNAGRELLPYDGDCDFWQFKTSSSGESCGFVASRTFGWTVAATATCGTRTDVLNQKCYRCFEPIALPMF
jgi:hypothetical protein